MLSKVNSCIFQIVITICIIVLFLVEVVCRQEHLLAVVDLYSWSDQTFVQLSWLWVHLDFHLLFEAWQMHPLPLVHQCLPLFHQNWKKKFGLSGYRNGFHIFHRELVKARLSKIRFFFQTCFNTFFQFINDFIKECLSWMRYRLFLSISWLSSLSLMASR